MAAHCSGGVFTVCVHCCVCALGWVKCRAILCYHTWLYVTSLSQKLNPGHFGRFRNPGRAPFFFLGPKREHVRVKVDVWSCYFIWKKMLMCNSFFVYCFCPSSWRSNRRGRGCQEKRKWWKGEVWTVFRKTSSSGKKSSNRRLVSDIWLDVTMD